MSVFQSNKFFFIFSTNDVSRIDDHFSEFKYTCLRKNIKYKNIEINSKREFIEFMRELEIECKESGVQPFIHFECHGTENGLILKSKAKVFWNELANFLTKINIACKNNLFVTFSTCFGGNLTFPVIDKAVQKIECRTPVYGLIGPLTEISYGDARECYDEFFATIINENSLDTGIEKLVTKLREKTGVITLSCEGLLRKLFDINLKMELERKFKSKIQFNAWLSNQRTNHFRRTGRYLSDNELDQLAEISSSKKFYLEYYQNLHSKFLMLDLYPENKHRFGKINNIDNWDVFMKNISN